jgi:hypothetical protein
MKPHAYPVSDVPYAALVACPVWEFLPEAEDRDETWIKPVLQLPVQSLGARLVASFVRLASGQEALALIGNIELDDPRQNDHFLSLSLIRPNGERFHLARYHDFNFEVQGPNGLAAFLGLTLSEVFPIHYDVSALVAGERSGSRGEVPLEPAVRLSSAELMQLAVGSNVP